MCMVMKEGLKPLPGDDDGKWTILESEYLSRRPWLTARRDRVQLPNGNVNPEYYVLEYPTWINIIAITRDGRMVLVRQYRHALQVTRYELCAGVMDPTDASPMAAAQRELMEETGYGGGQWEEFMVAAPNPGSFTNLSHTFLARDVEPLRAPQLESTEDLSVHLFTPQQVYGMLSRGELIQVLMMAPLWKYFHLHPLPSDDALAQTGEVAP